MFRLLSLILLAVSASALATTDYTFADYVKEYKKPWKVGSEEYTTRAHTFATNMARITAHNLRYEAGKSSYKMGVNSMTAMDSKEFKTRFGFDKKMHHVGAQANLLGSKLEAAGIESRPVRELPASVDWRDAGIVSPVKDQGHCGSCWAFASTAVLESHVAKESGLLYSLSPQQLASCAPNPKQCGGTGGCFGATYDVSFGYAADVTAAGSGLYQEFQYAYNSYYGDDFDCLTDSANMATTDPVAGIEGYAVLGSNNYTQLMNAIAFYGPVAVVADASDWSTYESGIFDGCNTDSPDINHGIVIVGYGECEVHGKYWIVRNSWSPAFGEGGYIRLRRDDNDADNCAIDTTPQDGTACAGDDTPQKVCGSCGILFNSVVPIGAYAYATDESGRHP